MVVQILFGLVCLYVLFLHLEDGLDLLSEVPEFINERKHRREKRKATVTPIRTELSVVPVKSDIQSKII